jgi:septum formation protein
MAMVAVRPIPTILRNSSLFCDFSMPAPQMNLILGSQSPRRRELMQALLGSERLVIRPPLSQDEPGFDGCHDIRTIESQLRKLVDIKYRDVAEQSDDQTDDPILCADTIVVVQSTGQNVLVLGKPPQHLWQDTVRHWFRKYYSGKTHEVWTCFQLKGLGQSHSQTIKTKVTMPDIDEQMLEWYLNTDEPIGKAGGYGIQEHASLFVSAIEGSLTNVMGLPMFEVSQTLRKMSVWPR